MFRGAGAGGGGAKRGVSRSAGAEVVVDVAVVVEGVVM
jgi:hypothetical protein